MSKNLIEEFADDLYRDAAYYTTEALEDKEVGDTKDKLYKLVNEIAGLAQSDFAATVIHEIERTSLDSTSKKRKKGFEKAKKIFVNVIKEANEQNN